MNDLVFGKPLDQYPIASTKVTDCSVLVRRMVEVPSHERTCMVSCYRKDDRIWITVMAAQDRQTKTCLDVESAKAFLAILQREIHEMEMTG